MRINHIQAKNFKSLVDFKLDLAKFTVLIGLNGSGKSTVLQLIDFITQLIRGDLKGWLDERHWRPQDLNSRLTSRKNIEFTVMLSDKGAAGWQGSFNTSQLRCTSELISTREAALQVKDGEFSFASNSELSHRERISFSYEGSVLSQLKRETLPPSLLRFKDYFLGIRSLELLSPDQLRQRTRESSGSLGLGGQKLTSFLHEMGSDGRKKLTAALRKAYKHLDGLEARSLKGGWKQLEIQESYGGKKLFTEARHINDGMLRLMAILAELQSDHQFVLFDEIENGINPELAEFVLDALITARQQVLVTTHSPLILNYLSDEVARSGVMYLYKTHDGATHAIPFFSIPSLAKKLTVMGPGEAFADTNLMRLENEISQIPKVP